MAGAKRLKTTWLFNTDEERNNVYPYPGHIAIMADGSVYVCVDSGVWTKSSGGGGGGTKWAPITIN